MLLNDQRQEKEREKKHIGCSAYLSPPDPLRGDIGKHSDW
jgi:hypothetical protein